MTSVWLVSKGRKIERKKIVTVSEFTNKDFRDILFNQVSLVAVTTVTTRDSRRPKTHAKPTQVHASGRERVQPPNGTPASEQAMRAHSLLVLFC